MWDAGARCTTCTVAGGRGASGSPPTAPWSRPPTAGTTAASLAAAGVGRSRRRERQAALLYIGWRQRLTGQGLAVGRDMNVPSIREDAGELIVGHARPVPDVAHIKVNERRSR